MSPKANQMALVSMMSRASAIALIATFLPLSLPGVLAGRSGGWGTK